MVSGLLDSCLSTCSSISGSVISRAADILQGIAPAGTPRHKVWRACHHKSLTAQADEFTACQHVCTPRANRKQLKFGTAAVRRQHAQMVADLLPVFALVLRLF
jgi:hypothetical protein